MSDIISQLPFSPSQLGVSSLIAFFGWALATNFLYTRGQVIQILDANREASGIWKEVAKENQEIIKLQTEHLQTLVAQSAATLRILEELQNQAMKWHDNMNDVGSEK